jgi:hypothetical protein
MIGWEAKLREAARIASMDLPGRATDLAVHLLTYLNPTHGVAFPSVSEELCGRLNAAEDSIGRASATLVRAGVLKTALRRGAAVRWFPALMDMEAAEAKRRVQVLREEWRAGCRLGPAEVRDQQQQGPAEVRPLESASSDPKLRDLNSVSKIEKEEPNIYGADLIDSVEVENQDALSLEREFEKFWTQCAKRAGEGAARRAYFAIIKSGKATTADLLQGMMRYAAERADADRAFTKKPAKWLKDGCWTDEPGANAPALSKNGDGSSGGFALARAAGQRGGAIRNRMRMGAQQFASETQPKDERWARVKETLRAELPEDKFNCIADTCFEGVHEGCVRLRASPSEASMIKKHHMSRLLELWKLELPEVHKLSVWDSDGERIVGLLRTGTE